MVFLFKVISKLSSGIFLLLILSGLHRSRDQTVFLVLLQHFLVSHDQIKYQQCWFNITIFSLTLALVVWWVRDPQQQFILTTGILTSKPPSSIKFYGTYISKNISQDYQEKNNSIMNWKASWETFFYKHKDKEDYCVGQNLLNHKSPSI